jgi:hypothetical protein
MEKRDDQLQPLLNYSGARTRKSWEPCIDIQVDAHFVFKRFPSPEKIFRNFVIKKRAALHLIKGSAAFLESRSAI